MSIGVLCRKAIKKYRQDGIVALAVEGTDFIISTILYVLKKPELNQGRYEYHGVSIDCRFLHSNVQRAIASNSMEVGTLKHIDNHLPRDYPVVEFGGGIGIVSCYIDTHLDDGVSQIVFEPNENIIRKLRENRTENGAKFEIVQAAYEPSNKEIELTVGDAYWSASTVEDEKEECLNVEGTNLKRILNEYDIQKFSVTSNIEGGEYEIIYNEMDVLKRNCDTMIIAFHDVPDYSMTEAVEYITENGFDCIDKGGNKKYVFRNRTE